MKTKFFFLLAALLLNVCAFAQSENTTPLKGDVNNDGTVDVADINAVIEIMKNGGGTGEETKYYWYVGTTKPMSLSQATVVDSYKSEYTYTNNSGAKSHIFVLTNSNKNVTFIEPNFNAPISQVDVDATTIPGYKIFETAVGTANTGSIKIRVDAAAAPTYYWYAGQTQPTSMTSVTAQDSGIFTNNNWHTINVNNTYSFKNPIYNSESNPIKGDINTYWYVALPADKSYGIYDSDDVDEVNVSGNWTKLTSQITIANVTYNIYKKVSTSRQFNGYWIH